MIIYWDKYIAELYRLCHVSLQKAAKFILMTIKCLTLSNSFTIEVGQSWYSVYHELNTCISIFYKTRKISTTERRILYKISLCKKNIIFLLHFVLTDTSVHYTPFLGLYSLTIMDVLCNIIWNRKKLTDLLEYIWSIFQITNFDQSTCYWIEQRFGVVC